MATSGRLCALIAAVLLAGCAGSANDSALRLNASGAPEVVSYQAQDGVRIIADFYAPLNGGPAPVVLLLHQFGGERDQWDPIVADILRWGYAILAPDLRSFGDSTTILIGGAEERYELEDLDDIALDVAAAIDYLATRQDINNEAIAIIGASLGGNLAYVASGAYPEVLAAISISPNATPSGGALLGKDIESFNPHTVLFMSDEGEAADVRKLAANVAEPVEVRVYEGRSAHGVQLLAESRAVMDIRAWLDGHLPLTDGN